MDAVNGVGIDIVYDPRTDKTSMCIGIVLNGIGINDVGDHNHVGVDKNEHSPLCGCVVPTHMYMLEVSGPAGDAVHRD